MEGDERNTESPPLEMELNDDDAVEIIELEGQDIDGREPYFIHTSHSYDRITDFITEFCVKNYHFHHLSMH